MTFDQSFFQALHGLAGNSEFFDWLVIFFASYFQYVLVALFLVFLLVKTFPISKWKIFWAGVVSVIISRGIITTVIRYFYHKPRPFIEYNFQPLVIDNAYSFPSGHATFFFALSAVVFFYNKRWGTIFFLASIFITTARVIAGVHYPSDILGGALIGLIVGYLTVKLFAKKT